MRKLDCEALELAVQQCRADPVHTEQIADKLRNEDWETVAEFCSYSCQMNSLNLKPWEISPCEIDNPDDPDDLPRPYEGRYEAADLLKRMLAAGVSKFHPDPLAAIEAASARNNRSRQLRQPNA